MFESLTAVVCSKCRLFSAYDGFDAASVEVEEHPYLPERSPVGLVLGVLAEGARNTGSDKKASLCGLARKTQHGTLRKPPEMLEILYSVIPRRETSEWPTTSRGNTNIKYSCSSS